MQNEDIEIVSDSQTVDTNLSGSFYGNIGRCLQFNSNYDRALNCLYKSFAMIFMVESSNRILNLGYAADWISEVLFEKKDMESSYYFLRYAVMMWHKCSPPLSNRCKSKLKKYDTTNTTNSILSLQFWQIEKYCKAMIKKNTKIDDFII